MSSHHQNRDYSGYPVLVSTNESVGAMQKTNIDPEIQMEMGHIGDMDPKLVAVVKGHPGQARNEPSVEGFQKIGNGKTDKEKTSITDDDDGDQSDFDLDIPDYENREEAWEEANFLEKGVLTLQFAVITGYHFLKKVTKGHFLKIAFLVGFTAYFIAAMAYRFGDEGSHRLLGCTLLGIVIVLFPYLKQFAMWAVQKCYGSNSLSTRHSEMWRKAKTVIRWGMYVVMTGIMIYTIVDEGRKKPKNMRSLPGIGIFILIAVLFSTKPSRVPWHTIFWSVALQFICAVFVLKWSFGKSCFIWVQDRFTEFFDNTKAGSILLFGEKYTDHPNIFGAFPMLLFINAAFTVLYYLGAMQYIIKVIGKILRFFLGITYLEATLVSLTIFLEGIATVMSMRPFVGKMTKSQLFLLLTAAMASLGGGVVAFLSVLGLSLEYLVPAMLISAPATFSISKVMFPDSKDSEDADEDELDNLMNEDNKKYTSVLDAAQAGALMMMPVLASVLVVLYTFMSGVSWVNNTLEWFGDRVGIDKLSFEVKLPIKRVKASTFVCVCFSLGSILMNAYMCFHLNC
ncbi:sodium/nucleoside cotransporter [Elysia marginata]|uniref:Sodium/nucleoside cotransporter n=1 Tax=Elysia marginata TaxID=1093978 RepID=A0AAV4H7F9_9GAST|nr:sodium/nucleoside cotransporter [Elysia marginata]